MTSRTSTLLFALPLVSLLSAVAGCASATEESADGDDSSEEALTAALTAPLYDCNVEGREQIPGPTIPQHTLIVPQGKKAVTEMTRVLHRTRDASSGNYYGSDTKLELSEDANITKSGKVVTIAANGYTVAIDTSKKTTSPYYGGPAFKGKLVEGAKNYTMTCRALSQKDWFDENVRSSAKPSDNTYAEVVRINQVPEALRPKLEAANKSIDADAVRSEAHLSPGGRYFAVYYTSSRKTPAGYAVWAGDREGANGEIERVYWVIGFSMQGKEVLREMAGLGG